MKLITMLSIMSKPKWRVGGQRLQNKKTYYSGSFGVCTIIVYIVAWWPIRCIWKELTMQNKQNRVKPALKSQYQIASWKLCLRDNPCYILMLNRLSVTCNTEQNYSNT